MILQSGIPGQLAGLRTAVEALVESGTPSDVPGAGATNNPAGQVRLGFLAASAVTSTSYIDAVDVSGAGLLYLAQLTVSGNSTAAYLRLEVDGVTFTEVTATTAASDGAAVLCALGVLQTSTLAGATDSHLTLWPPLLTPIPYRTGFKLQAKRTSGTGTCTPRYIYIPYTLS